MTSRRDDDGDLYTERALPPGSVTLEGGGLSYADRSERAFEVFAQYGGHGKPISHVGSVRAADPDLAWHAAKEAYTRREDCTLLWVAPRSAIKMSNARDQEVLAAGRRVTYRLPSYPIAHRRARGEAVSGRQES